MNFEIKSDYKSWTAFLKPEASPLVIPPLSRTQLLQLTDYFPFPCFAEAHEYGDGNPLLALLLLLGIPAGICCCCRKKIFKKKATNATMLQVKTQEIS